MRLLKIALSRLVSLLPTLILATVIVFVLQRLIPGDPATAIAGEYASSERLDQIREQLGLDKPLPIQYVTWLLAVLQGDLGVSFMTGESVAFQIADRLPLTLLLTAFGLVVAIVIGLPAGILAATKEGTRIDRLLTTGATLGIAIPNFWLGMMLILLFSLTLGWFPGPGGPTLAMDPVRALWGLVLPAIALGMVGSAEICRQVRSAMVEDLRSDHVRTLRSKGLSERLIVWRHALKNSGLPLLTVIGLQVSKLLGGAVVIEAVFGLAGLGTLIVTATNQREYLVVQGVVLVMALLVLITNFIIDVSYRYLDPRISQ